MDIDDLTLFGFEAVDHSAARQLFAQSEVDPLPDGDWFVRQGQFDEEFWCAYLNAEDAGIADYTFFVWNQDGDAWMLFGLKPPELVQLPLF